MKNKYVLIGGSDAAISAALRIKELDAQTKVQLFLADEYPNFSICGIPFYFSREVTDWTTLAHRTRQDILDLGIEVFSSHWVSVIDPDNKTIRANDKTFEYDKLLIGTGAQSIKPPIQGLENKGVFTLRWIGEMLEIDGFIQREKVNKVTIVGGGYIGVEMADGLRLRGLEVDLVEFLPSVLQTLDEPLGEKVGQELNKHGVRVHTNTRIESIEQTKNGLIVHGSNHYKNDCQLVLVVVGASPNTSLATSAGIELTPKGAIKTNLKMETNVQDIYAAGDCIETYHALLKQYVYIPLGTTAHKQGRIAGENMTGGNVTFRGSLGSQVVKIFDLVAGRTGLHDRDCERFNIPHKTVESQHWDHKVYYPGAELSDYPNYWKSGKWYAPWSANPRLKKIRNRKAYRHFCHGYSL
ncbi:MAG: FAD-dependent oxidoreductase [Bacteroidales bacterium]|nr:FAD-dependent oxidoreductase [Bacteroidales bacterium]